MRSLAHALFLTKPVPVMESSPEINMWCPLSTLLLLCAFGFPCLGQWTLTTHVPPDTKTSTQELQWAYAKVNGNPNDIKGTGFAIDTTIGSDVTAVQGDTANEVWVWVYSGGLHPEITVIGRVDAGVWGMQSHVVSSEILTEVRACP